MKLTVLMTTYNVEHYIKETMQSLFAQTYKNFELLIIDDASTDNTVSIINSINDSRIKLIQLDENVGVGMANNIGLKYVNTEFIAKADSDDIYMPTRFEKQINYLERNKNVGVVKCLITFFPDNYSVERSNRFKYFKSVREKLYNSGNNSKEIKKILYCWDCIPHNSVMARTSVIKSIGYDNLRFGEDTTLFYKINDNGYIIDSINECLVKFRVRDNSITAKVNADQFHFKYDLKKNKIKNFINNKKVYIWGTGTLARVVVKNLKKNDLFKNVIGFIDGTLNTYICKRFCGLKVYPKQVLLTNKINVLVAAEPAIIPCIKFFKLLNYNLGKDYYIF